MNKIGRKRFHASAWEGSECIVSYYQNAEDKSWEDKPIGSTIDRHDAAVIAEWLNYNFERLCNVEVEKTLKEFANKVKGLAGEPFPGELPRIQDEYFKQEVDSLLTSTLEGL